MSCLGQLDGWSTGVTIWPSEQEGSQGVAVLTKAFLVYTQLIQLGQRILWWMARPNQFIETLLSAAAR